MWVGEGTGCGGVFMGAGVGILMGDNVWVGVVGGSGYMGVGVGVLVSGEGMWG